MKEAVAGVLRTTRSTVSSCMGTNSRPLSWRAGLAEVTATFARPRDTMSAWASSDAAGRSYPAKTSARASRYLSFSSSSTRGPAPRSRFAMTTPDLSRSPHSYRSKGLPAATVNPTLRLKSLNEMAGTPGKSVCKYGALYAQSRSLHRPTTAAWAPPVYMRARLI